MWRIILYTALISCACVAVIIEGPDDTFGLENQKVVLTCSIKGADSNLVSWYRDDKLFDLKRSGGGISSKTLSDSTVHVSVHFPLTKDNEGIFYCNASSSGMWITSRKAQVRIAFLDEEFVLEPQDKAVSVGETVLFECVPPIGIPKATVKWMKDNASLSADERIQIMENGKLRIDRIVWGDKGQYVCVAESFAFRRQTSPALLSVRQRPYFLVSPLSQSVPVYSAFELSCRAAGEPMPTILWRRDPPSLEISYRRARLLLSGTLQFAHSQLDDAGDYVCRASSPAGVIEAIAHINIISPPGLVQTAPGVLSVMEGYKVEMPCLAVGSPYPDIRWVRKSERAFFIAGTSTSADRVFVTGDGTLIIQVARLDDSSMYECRASSPAGLTRSLTHLVVTRNPGLIPARFGALSLSRISTSIRGRSNGVRISCRFPSDKILTVAKNPTDRPSNSLRNGDMSIAWLFNGMPLTRQHPGNRTSIEKDGSLLIPSPQDGDEGNYTCMIFNRLSQRYARWTVELSLERDNKSPGFRNVADHSALPGKPEDLTVVGIGDTWLALTWTDVAEYSYGYKLFYLPVIFNSSSKPLTSIGANSRWSSEFNQQVNEYPPNLDVWFSTPLIREKRTRLVKLLPDTGYWVEVRKVNQFGLSEGQISPNIIYTLRKPFKVEFPLINKLNGTQRNDFADYSGSLLTGVNTAVDFQDLLSSFQSISFRDINVRSLTSTELLTTWTTRSSDSILEQIDGFRMNIRPVPMSRCLATATAGALRQLSSFPLQDSDQGLSSAEHSAPLQSFISPVHCSLSSDRLLEQILRMSNVAPVQNLENEKDLFSLPLMAPTPATESVVVMRTVSPSSPTTSAVGGSLLPFTCYEVDIEAFKDDLTYGRIWSRSSVPELALTLDASPGFPPLLTSAQWFSRASSPGLNMTATTPRTQATSSGLHIVWRPLDLRMAHGALIGYVIHFLSNESQHARSLRVPADVQMRDIFGLNPFVEYTIYLAGVTCRGEGVRGPGHQLPSAVSFFENSMDGKTGYIVGDLDGQQHGVRFPKWAYAIIAVVIVFWVIVGLLILLLSRRHTNKQQTNDCTLPDTTFSTPSKSGVLKVNNDSSGTKNNWHQTVLSHNRSKRNKCRPSQSDYDIEHALPPDEKRSNVEMANLLQQKSASQNGSALSEQIRPGACCGPVENRPRAGGQCKSESNLKIDPATHNRSACPDGFDRSTFVAGDDAEIYANSDPSVVSDPVSPVLPPRASSSGSGSHGGIGHPNSNTNTRGVPNSTRGQLPNPVNFPLSNAYHFNGFGPNSSGGTITNPNSGGSDQSSDNFNRLSSSPMHEPPNQFTVSPGTEDAVPPYASCTVMPMTVRQCSYPPPDHRQIGMGQGQFVQQSSVNGGETFVNSPAAFVSMSKSIAGQHALILDSNQSGMNPSNCTLQQQQQLISSWTGQPVCGPTRLLPSIESPPSIPPPPEYPPPPLPACGTMGRVAKSQPSYLRSLGSGVSGTSPHPLTECSPFATPLSADPSCAQPPTYYASGGIYAQAQDNALPLAYPLNGLGVSNPGIHSPYSLKANDPVGYYPTPNASRVGRTEMHPPIEGEAETYSSTLIKPNYPVVDRSPAVPPAYHRAGKPLSSGPRSGDGSSSGRSTTSGLGSGGPASGSGKCLSSHRVQDALLSGSLSGSDSSGSAFRQGVGHLGSVVPPCSVTITTRTQPLPSSQPLPPMTQPAFYPNQVFTNDRTNLRSRDESAHPQSCLTPDSSSCDSSRPTVVFGRHMTSSTRPTTSDPSDVNTSLVVCNSRVSNCHPSHSTDDLPPPSSNINV